MAAMFRIIPHRAFVEPQAVVTDVKTGGETATATLHIDGLLCSACAANVRRRLEAVGGVRAARVDLEHGEAQVTYDAARCRPDALVAAVEGAVILRPLRRLLARLGRRSAARTAH